MPPVVSGVFDAPVPRPHRALLQALGTGAVAIGLVAIGVAAARAPDDVDETKIVVAHWRSLGAETDLVSAHADALPARFVRAHAEQMGQAEDEADDELRELHPRPDVRVDREAVERCVRAIGAATRSLQGGHGAPPGACTDRLQRIEQALER